MIQAEDVYDVLRKIPEGKVTTYGDIAKAIGHPKASRAVGRILHANPNPIIVPCHRVVMSDGKLGGYADGVEKKIRLLKKEGLDFKNNKVENFEKKKAVLKKN